MINWGWKMTITKNTVFYVFCDNDNCESYVSFWKEGYIKAGENENKQRV